MLEVYVILAMGALGYLLNTMNNSVKSTKQQVNKFEMPNQKNIYDSNYVQKAQETERHIAEKAYKEALHPKKTNRIMTMAGEVVNADEFTHNNMEPYFGGRIKQNVVDDRNRTLLENFTGVSDIKKNKCEVKSFYDQSKDLGNVYGVANRSDFYQDRIEQPRLRNNELPMEQIRVGPGVGLGYTANPTGGFQQYEDGEFARAAEKCVDQLRVKNNPKTTFAARKVDGLKTGLRGDVGKVNKNKVERFYEQSPDMLLKTTGAILKPTQIPKFNVKATNRFDTSKEYAGIIKGRTRRAVDSDVKDTSRQQMGPTGIRNAVLSMFGLKDTDDYGKKGIVVYSNERDLTTVNTYNGNLTSLVKAIIAPLEDILKTSKKEEFTNHPRPYGELNPQMPDKPTLHNDDVAKSTIRETTENAADPANLKGAEKIKIYLDDNARTTTRQLLEEEELHRGNLKGAEKIQIWDPTDTARTTIAETLLQSTEGMGSIKGPTEIYVYDPDEIAKRTVRETLKDIDYHANLASTHKKNTLQFDDDAKPTMKETTIENMYDAGIDGLEGGGAYEVTEYDAKTIARQFLADTDRIGGAAHDLGMGYETNPHEAKLVQKAFIADNDYYGHAEGSHKKQKSYNDYENAHIDERKEVILSERTPVPQGTKQFNDSVNVRVKQDCSTKWPREQNNMDRVYSQAPQMSDRGITKQRLSVEIDSKIGYDRIDPDLLNALRQNPYNISVA